MKEEVRKFEKILVEMDGKLINITDLKKIDYEAFLDLMLQLRSAYIAATRICETH